MTANDNTKDQGAQATEPKAAYKIEGAAFEKIAPIYKAGVERAKRIAKEQADMQRQWEKEMSEEKKALWNAVEEALGCELKNYRFDDSGAAAGVFLILKTNDAPDIGKVIEAISGHLSGGFVGIGVDHSCPTCDDQDQAKETAPTTH